MSEQKVFVQYTYCPLCQINHKRGKKHAHSPRHKEIVANILKKFGKKIAEAKACLIKPVVQDTTWGEQSSMFWCYFCQMDAARHTRKYTIQGECISVNGGMLEHITREDHTQNAVKFLKENMADVKRTQEFSLSSKDFLKYLEDSERACISFLNQRAAELGKEAQRIWQQEYLRRETVSAAMLEQNVASQSSHDAQRVQQITPQRDLAGSQMPPSEIERKKTARAFGEGLTAVDRSQEDDSVGNIFSNAVPPWLAQDPEDSAPSQSIKPDFADLEKHKKLVKKSKLQANRVGANFDHQNKSSKEWLPNFGGVWNKGRRTKSAEQFHHRKFGKYKSQPSTSTATSTNTQNPSNGPLDMQHGIKDFHQPIPSVSKGHSFTAQNPPPSRPPNHPWGNSTNTHPPETHKNSSLHFGQATQSSSHSKSLQSGTWSNSSSVGAYRFSSTAPDTSPTPNYTDTAIMDSASSFSSISAEASIPVNIRPYTRKRKLSGEAPGLGLVQPGHHLHSPAWQTPSSTSPAPHIRPYQPKLKGNMNYEPPGTFRLLSTPVLEKKKS